MVSHRLALPLAADLVRVISHSSSGGSQRASYSTLALAGWDHTIKEHELAIFDLAEGLDASGGPGQLGLEQLAHFTQSAQITALQVAAFEEGRVACLTGGSDGCLRRLQLLIPHLSGADPADIQLVGQDTEQGALLPWQKLHTSSITGLDVHPSTAPVVTAGLDGALQVIPMSSATPSFSSAQAHVQGRATVSYRAVHWSTPDTFVAAGTTGGVEVWDKRVRGLHPAACSPLPHGLAGDAQLEKQQGMRGQINCLDVHPAQPFTCVTGASQGCVVLWDLRFAAAPCAACVSSDSQGDVLEVHFEPSAVQQSILVCTDSGQLARCSSSDSAQTSSAWDPWIATSNGYAQQEHRRVAHAKPVYSEEYASILSFDVQARSSTLQDVFCVTDHQCLIHAQLQPE